MICFDVDAPFWSPIGAPNAPFLPAVMFHGAFVPGQHESAGKASIACYVVNVLRSKLESFWEVQSVHAGFWEILMDASFFLDVILNFRTAFIGTDFLVTDHGAIAVHYLQACLLVFALLQRSQAFMNSTCRASAKLCISARSPTHCATHGSSLSSPHCLV
jgi:hypothetical protein